MSPSSDASKPQTPETSLGRYLLISADGHAGPPLPGFAPYFDPEYREAFDRYWRARPNSALAEAAAGGDLEALAQTLVAFMRATGASDEVARGFAERALRLSSGVFDSKVRDECLDEEGIVAEILFGDGFLENRPPFTDSMDSGGQLFGNRKSWPFELRLAGARASAAQQPTGNTFFVFATIPRHGRHGYQGGGRGGQGA